MKHVNYNLIKRTRNWLSCEWGAGEAEDVKWKALWSKVNWQGVHLTHLWAPISLQYTKISLVLDSKLQVYFIFLWCTQPVFFSANYNLLWWEKYFPVVSHEDVLPQHIQGISRKCQRDTSQTGVFITCGFCSQHGRIAVKGSIPMQTWQIMLNYI